MLKIFKKIAHSKKSDTNDHPQSKKNSASPGINNNLTSEPIELFSIEDCMQDDQVDEELDHLLAQWWRYVDESRSREPNISGPMHLMSLDRPMHALARRAIEVDGKLRLNKTTIILYHQALSNICIHVHKALETGQLTARDDLVGLRSAAPSRPEPKFERSLTELFHRRHHSAAAELLRDAPGTVDTLFPGVLIDPVQFSRWAEAEGIARTGELDQLLRKRVPSTEGAGEPQSVKAQAPADAMSDWKATARACANEIYKLERGRQCDPSKEQIARMIAHRFECEGTLGRRGRLSAEYIERHALRNWKKPS
jgi:hypothetical protein